MELFGQKQNTFYSLLKFRVDINMIPHLLTFTIYAIKDDNSVNIVLLLSLIRHIFTINPPKNNIIIKKIKNKRNAKKNPKVTIFF